MKNNNGFSILAMVALVAVVGLVVFAIVVSTTRQVDKSRLEDFRGEMQGLVPAMTSCLDENGTLQEAEMDKLAEDGGPVCFSGSHGNHVAAKERRNCDGSGAYQVKVKTGQSYPQGQAFEAFCRQDGPQNGCRAICTANGCQFEAVGEGSCY